MYYPILFHIGKLNFYTHGLLMVIGAILGGIILYKLAKKTGEKTDFIFDLVIYTLVGGLVGARLFYLILYYNQFNGLRDMLYIWNGGLVSYGGMIGGLVVAYIFVRAKKENIYTWFDLGAIGLFAGWALGRIGCFLANDSWGNSSASFLSIGGRLPVTLFESIWSLLIAMGGYCLLRSRDRLKLGQGIVFWAVLGGYAIGRFVIDVFRMEDVFLFGLKSGQISSILVIIIAVLNIYFLRKKGGSNGN